MTRYIAILRGINVGGRRSLPMSDLRTLFQDLGFAEVKTYIQSGNVIFNAEGTGEVEISNAVEKAIFERFGYEVPVICRTAEALQQSIVKNPFFADAVGEIERLHLTFLKKTPEEQQLKKLKECNFYPDKFIVWGNNIFIYCSGKYSDSRLTNSFFENKLKVAATTRNWKTILHLGKLV